jgi:hypothetical protein
LDTGSERYGEPAGWIFHHERLRYLYPNAPNKRIRVTGFIPGRSDLMKPVSVTLLLCIILLLIFCFVTAIIGAESVAVDPVAKNSNMQPAGMPPGPLGAPPDFANDTAFQERMVQSLESQGVDTTELKGAIASGNQDKIRAVMDSIRDKMPQPPMNGTPGSDGPGSHDFANDSAFLERMVQDLESRGVDTTELKAAIASGNQEKIRAVMDSIRDRMPQPPMNGTPGREGIPPGSAESQGSPAGKSSVQPEQTQEPQPAATRSPLSPLTVLAGLGAAGTALVSMKKR